MYTCTPSKAATLHNDLAEFVGLIDIAILEQHVCSSIHNRLAETEDQRDPTTALAKYQIKS